MVDAQNPGYYQPTYGTGIGDRLYCLVGREVTVYFQQASPVRGTLRRVGRDYIELQRVREDRRETVLVPLAGVVAVTGPVMD